MMRMPPRAAALLAAVRRTGAGGSAAVTTVACDQVTRAGDSTARLRTQRAVASPDGPRSGRRER